MLVSKYQLISKCQWLGSLLYNGEECEIFVQEGAYIQIYVVPSSELVKQDLQCVGTVFDHIVIKRTE